MVNGDSDTPSWLARARRELGVREGKDDTRILQYHQCTGLKARSSKVPWCASYVCFCLEQEGVKSTRSATAASYKTFGKESEVRPGAIIVFPKFDIDSGGTGHVGFVNAWPVGGTVEVISGNCANSVKLKNYKWRTAVAVRWPEFP
jgi:uncharacterized protein (TIGR02594 family)